MQNYNKDLREASVWKRILLEFLDFLRFKVDNDLLTAADVESVARAVEETLPVYATADDLARFYGQPRTNVSSLINRKMLDKPVRRVYYRFNVFRRLVPEKWKCSTQGAHGQALATKA